MRPSFEFLTTQNNFSSNSCAAGPRGEKGGGKRWRERVEEEGERSTATKGEGACLRRLSVRRGMCVCMCACVLEGREGPAESPRDGDSAALARPNLSSPGRAVINY